MKVGLVLCFLVVSYVSVSDAQASLKNLQGVWIGSMSAVDIAIVTEQGVELVCVNTLPCVTYMTNMKTILIGPRKEQYKF